MNYKELWKNLPSNWKKALKKQIKLPFWKFNPNLKQIEEIFMGNEINLNKSKIDDLSPLSNFKHIKELNVAVNSINSINMLKYLKNLEIFIAAFNQISNINVFNELPLLNDIGISNNKIADISPLINCKNLTDLDIAYNPISDISPINYLPIEYIDFSNTNVTDLKQIENLSKTLKTVIFCETKITDISPLGNFCSLEEIDCESSEINSIEPIMNLENLQFLYIMETNVPLSEVEKFEELHPKCEVYYHR